MQQMKKEVQLGWEKVGEVTHRGLPGTVPILVLKLCIARVP